MTAKRICQIHAEEACGPTCSIDCRSKEHERPAIPHYVHPIHGAVCEECAGQGEDRTYQVQYAHACGYRD